MSNQVKPIPEGYHSVTPYLVVDRAAEVIEFYKRGFGAKELFRMGGPEGRIAHAELQIGDSRIMLADESPEMKTRAPGSIGGTPVSLMLYVEDVDAVFRAAIQAGATLDRAVEDMFYGDRSGSLTDPCGHKWFISTHKEDLSPEEIQHRAMAAH